MSNQITTAFVEQYAANLLHLSQQKGSRLRSAVRLEQVTGRNAYIDRIGQAAARKRTSRHGDTPQLDTPHSRRRVSLSDYDWADLVDDLDKVRLLIDPASAYSQAGAWAMGRAMDDEIIAAFTGTAYAGVDGTSTVALPSGQKVTAGAAGLTVAKLLSAKEILDGNDVDESIARYVAVTSKQVSDLLNTTEVKSSDYNTVKALAQGELDSFLGFKFIRTERLGVDGSGNRRVVAWAQDGMALAIGKEPTARIDERADKNYATQVYYSMAIGATRLEEEKVVEIACVES
ncbi:MAG TPA: phage capsid protein [Alphaproteobacteria bacterium]|nr:phage capsid protein [Alphaproteobacteria bacterium]